MTSQQKKKAWLCATFAPYAVASGIGEIKVFFFLKEYLITAGRALIRPSVLEMRVKTYGQV